MAIFLFQHIINVDALLLIRFWRWACWTMTEFSTNHILIMMKVIRNINNIIQWMILMILMIIIYLKNFTFNFLQIAFLKVMFECVEASCSFYFFRNSIPQSRTNKIKGTLNCAGVTWWLLKFIVAILLMTCKIWGLLQKTSFKGYKTIFCNENV